jgi:hypothetical protein
LPAVSYCSALLYTSSWETSAEYSADYVSSEDKGLADRLQ